MILHPPPGTPLWALYIHIIAGNLAILSGTAALVLRRGQRMHRTVGDAFVAIMLIMAGMAVYMGFVIPQPSNVTGGLFTVYLVGTAWMTVRRREGTIGAFEVMAAFVPVGIVAADLCFGWIASHSVTGKFDRYQPIYYWVFAGICSIAPLLDLNMILRRGLIGRRRIARHVWRMCTAFSGASASFFIGQQKMMPVWMHGSPVLTALALAPWVAMIFWLARVAWSRQFKREPVAA